MSIDAELRALAARLEERIPELVERIVERSTAEVPEYYGVDDPALLDVDRRSIGSALMSIFEGLGHGRTPPERPSGTEIELARLAAQANVDLHAFLRTYRVAQAITWDAVLEDVEAAVEDAELRVAVLTLASHYLFDWNDRVTSKLVEIYQSERDAMFRDRERLKREVIRDLLNGLPVDVGRLSYPLGGWHLAVIAWGVAPEKAVRQLATGSHAALLTVAGTGGALIAWLGGDAIVEASPPVGDGFEPPPGTFVALGRPAEGLEGFRTTHRQAQQAYRVARVRAGAVTRYQDVALETLVVRDLQQAREFVTNELGLISGDDHRDTVLRATLRAYFQTGQNASSAAHLLGVHERTVAYRLRSIEQRLGIPISARREELAVALRLMDLLETPHAPIATDGIELQAEIETTAGSVPS